MSIEQAESEPNFRLPPWLFSEYIAVYCIQTGDATLIKRLWETFPDAGDRLQIIRAMFALGDVPEADAFFVSVLDDFSMTDGEERLVTVEMLTYREVLVEKAHLPAYEDRIRMELTGENLGINTKSRIARAAFSRPDEVSLEDYARILKLASDVMVAEPGLTPLILEGVGVAPPGRAPSEPGK